MDYTERWRSNADNQESWSVEESGDLGADLLGEAIETGGPDAAFEGGDAGEAQLVPALDTGALASAGGLSPLPEGRTSLQKRATRRLTIGHDDPFTNIFVRKEDGVATLEVELEETPTHVRAKRMHLQLEALQKQLMSGEQDPQQL